MDQIISVIDYTYTCLHMYNSAHDYDYNHMQLDLHHTNVRRRPIMKRQDVMDFSVRLRSALQDAGVRPSPTIVANIFNQKYWGKSYPLNVDEIDYRIDDNLGFLYLSKLFLLSFFFSFFFLQKNEERNGFCFSIS